MWLINFTKNCMAGLDGFIGIGDGTDAIDVNAVSVEVDLAVDPDRPDNRPPMTTFLPILLGKPEALGIGSAAIKVVPVADRPAAEVLARGVTRDRLAEALRGLRFRIVDDSASMN